MSTVSSEFRRFVHYIETDQHVFIKLEFASEEEFNRCVSFFFDKAISHKGNKLKFAQSAAKLYFLAAPESEVTFRKACISESQKRLEDLVKTLDSAGYIDPDEAVSITEFFGELYNVGFIFKGIVKKYLDIFYASISESLVAHTCFYALIKTVKEKAFKMLEQDQTVCIKALIEMIEIAELSPLAPPQTKEKREKRNEDSKPFEVKFPSLGRDSHSKLLNKSFTELKFEEFQSTLSELNRTNFQQISNKLDTITKTQFRDGQWQLYYNELMEKALENPNLAESIFKICQKLTQSHQDAWQGFKPDDCKKYIHELTTRYIEKFMEFDEYNDENIKKITNLVTEIMKTPFGGLNHIADYFKTITNFDTRNSSLKSKFLVEMLSAIKSKIGSNKIKKIPFALRREILEIILTTEVDCSPMTPEEIADYVGIDPSKYMADMETNNNDTKATISSDFNSSAQR
jgi:hypothetical protein